MIWITAFLDLDQYVCIDQYLLASTSSDQQKGYFEPALTTRSLHHLDIKWQHNG